MDAMLAARRTFGALFRRHYVNFGVAVTLSCLLPTVLYFAETRMRDRAVLLRAARATIVDAPLGVLAPDREGTLIHAVGLVTCAEPVQDAAFNLSVTALRLYRTVEMYQWVEVKEQVDFGGNDGKVTRTSYVKRWAPTLARMPMFPARPDLRNPSLMPYEERSVAASRCRLGALELPPDSLLQLGQFEPILLTDEQVAKVPTDLQGKVHNQRGQLFIGGKPDLPAVGDVRVAFQVVTLREISALAMQRTAALVPAPDQGIPQVLIADGNVAVDGLLALVEPVAAAPEWAVRVGAFVALLVAWTLLLRKLLPSISAPPFGPRSTAAGLAVLSATALTCGALAAVWLPFQVSAGLPFAAASTFATCLLGAAGVHYLLKRRREQRAIERSS
jgi:Transmembrane protein 43